MYDIVVSLKSQNGAKVVKLANDFVCRTIIFNFGYIESKFLILGIEIEILGMSIQN